DAFVPSIEGAGRRQGKPSMTAAPAASASGNKLAGMQATSSSTASASSSAARPSRRPCLEHRRRSQAGLLSLRQGEAGHQRARRGREGAARGRAAQDAGRAGADLPRVAREGRYVLAQTAAQELAGGGALSHAILAAAARGAGSTRSRARWSGAGAMRS